MSISRIWRHLSLLVVVLFALLLLAPVTAADNPNPGVLPPQSHPFGRSYAQWGDAWWQWVLAIPNDRNPLPDSPGWNCSVGQSGKVWFLAGTWASGNVHLERQCTMPSGKAVFLPVANSFYAWSTGDPPQERNSFAWLMQQARSYYTPADDLKAWVDGKQVELGGAHGPYYVESTGPFNITLPPDSVFGYVPDYNPTAQVGTYLMLAPLSVGPHTLRVYANFGGGNSLDFTYDLTVAPAGRYGR